MTRAAGTHRRARARSEGFTLMELMIVVFLIAVVAALAAPSIQRAQADRRTNQSALELVRLFRHARGDAAGYGRAYVVRIDPDDNDGEGSVEVLRGSNNGCNTATFEDDGDPNCQEASCVDVWPEPQARSTFDEHGYIIDLNTPAGAHELCFQPNGVVLSRVYETTPGAFVEGNADGVFDSGAIVYTLQRTQEGGTAEGVARRVAIPVGGGDARIMR